MIAECVGGTDWRRFQTKELHNYTLDFNLVEIASNGKLKIS